MLLKWRDTLVEAISHYKKKDDKDKKEVVMTRRKNSLIMLDLIDIATFVIPLRYAI